ncbi:MAG TPA: hypothetical protein VJ250_06360 [Nitrososphaeraceae archaeon]|nr:hypothetical protein [Nitrososphaeraceae archaeon]
MPGDKGYSPIVHLNLVNWNDNATARELRSAEEILIAQNSGKLEIARTNILLNSKELRAYVNLLRLPFVTSYLHNPMKTHLPP